MIGRYSSSLQLGKLFCLSVLALAALMTIMITGSNFSVKQKTTLKILLEPIDDSGEKTESRVNSLNSEQQQQAEISSILISEQTAAALPDYSHYNVTHWQPDWYTHTDDDIGDMLHIRRTAIIHRCANLKQQESFLKRLRPSGFHKEMLRLYKLQYCSTYKAGYTFWKNMLKTLRVKGAGHRLPKIKFTVTRNPWHRLVSVWKDRLSGAHGSPISVMRHFCRGKTWPTLPPFREFLEDCILANWRYGKMEAHWAPVLERCQVCSEAASFNFYLSQENLNKEASYMLGRLQVQNLTGLLASVQSQSLREGEGHRPSYQQYYRNISSKTINELRDIYKYELYLLDYPDTPFVDFPKA